MPDWEDEHVFKIEVDESRMRVIRNYHELLGFDKEYGIEEDFGAKYGKSIGYSQKNIDWRKVASDYGGIEIAPYIYKGRYDISWYYGWDVASGCIWGDGVIKGINRIS